jgi:hypothetical protein
VPTFEYIASNERKLPMKDTPEDTTAEDLAFVLLNADAEDVSLESTDLCSNPYFWASCSLSDCTGAYVCCNAVCNCAAFG